MNGSKGFFQQLMDILSPSHPPPPSHDLDPFDGGGFVIPLTDLTETEEEPPFDPTEFVRQYSEYMKEHYGRPAHYTTDLFCCMLPITVEITDEEVSVQTLHRYWWIPETHPVTSILLSHRVPNCGKVDAGICGSCIIYPDSFVIEWIGRILEYFKDANIELHTPVLASTEAEKENESSRTV